jgi:transcriptional regulator with AAA-type ATPase domain/tetratricopeptide (TPR) repeat protein
MVALGDLLGDSPGMRAVREKLARLLARPVESRRLPPILIQGETGTGKGLLARMIHRAGPRPDGPFVDVNCAAIPETLLEAEMFGFERGAFTDARRAKPGLFQAAHRGTIFLDEVGLLPEALQAKLLKVLEDRTVRRLGATRDEAVDVWIVTATNEDLGVAIRERRFREDLYHRLAVLTVTLPPLRERGSDIDTLAEHFVARLCADYGVAPRTLGPDARAALRAYPWPGNVRELSNVVERAVLQSSDEQITAEHLGLGPAAPPEPSPARAEALSLDDALRGHLVEVLGQTGWNISRTAALLGISRNTLRARMDKYGLRERDTAPKPAPPRARGAPSPPPRPVAAGRAITAMPPPASGRRWERRRVALLRAALVPSASADAPQETARVLEVLVEKVRTFGGKVEGLGPIGLGAAFGADASGDAADRAAHTALAIVKALERARREEGSDVGVKVGIHVTPVLVGVASTGIDLDMDDRRDVWPLLDELVERGSVGTVLVTDAAAAVLARRFELAPGPGGVAHGSTHRLVGRERTGLGLGGRVGSLVGRDLEVELLQNRLTLALGGQGQIVGLVGDAGIGKSRLILELRQRLTGSDVGYLEGHCHAYATEMPYLPVVELLHEACGLDDLDSPERVRHKVEAAVAELGLEASTLASDLLRLVGVKPGTEVIAELPAENLKRRLLDAFRQLMLRLARRRPLVLVVDDLHWCDAASEECLASLAHQAGTAPLLLLVTHRPGYRPPWFDRAHATQIALRPLPTEESRQLLRSLGGDRLEPAMEQRVLAKAEGNPFFLEELARALRDRAADGQGGIPDTIQDVLLARFDRLAPEDRALLQTASVIGKNVSLELLEAVSEKAEVAAGVRGLISAEFLAQQGEPAGDLTFRHTLTHEVVLGSVPADRRRRIDARVVEALERLHAGRTEQYVDRLGHHAFRGELWERAATYLHQAGIRAAARSAHREAVANFDRAIVALAHLPRTADSLQRALELRLDLRTSLTPLAEYGRLGDVLREAETIAESVGDRRHLGRVAAYASDYYRLMGDPEQAITAGRRALDIAGVEGDMALAVIARTYLGLAFYTRADHLRAMEFFRENVEGLAGDAERRLHGMAQLPAVHSRTWLVACLADRGDFDEADARAQEAASIADAVGHPLSRAVALFAAGYTDLRRGRPDAAVPALEQSLRLVREWSIGLWLPTVGAALGTAYVAVGRAAEAVTLLEEVTQQEARMKRVGSHSARLAALGEAYLGAGRPDDARRTAARALELASAHGERGYEAMATRVLAEAAAATGDATSAAARYAEAISQVRSLGWRPLQQAWAARAVVLADPAR